MIRIGDQTLLDNLFIGAFKAYIQSTDDIVFIKDNDLIYRAVSHSFCLLTGIDKPSDAIGKNDFELFKIDAIAEKYRDDDKRILKKGSAETYIEPVPALSGIDRWASTTKLPLYDSKHAPVGVMGVVRDISYKMRAIERYNNELSFLTTLRSNSLSAIVFDVTSWQILSQSANTKFPCACAKYKTIEGFIAHNSSDFSSRKDAGNFLSFFSIYNIKQLYTDGQRIITFECKRSASAGAFWQRDEYHLMLNPTDDHLIAVLVSTCIENEKRENSLLLHAAEHDSMTGLLNHSATHKYIYDFLDNEPINSQAIHALFFIDIDNFKSVNDNFGHLVGDSVIVNTAKLICSTFRQTDIVGRVGGDEFLVLLKNIQRISQISDRARLLLENLSFTHSEGDKSLKITASIGVAIWQSGLGCSFSQLMSEADSALYKAKRSGKHTFAFYDDFTSALTGESACGEK